MSTPLVFRIEVDDHAAMVRVEQPIVDVKAVDPRVVFAAIPGQRGSQGPAGTPGSGGVTHTQTTPAATWTITHPLGRKPTSVTVWLADELVDTTIETPDLATVVVTFATPQSGRAEII